MHSDCDCFAGVCCIGSLTGLTGVGMGVSLDLATCVRIGRADSETAGLAVGRSVGMGVNLDLATLVGIGTVDTETAGFAVVKSVTSESIKGTDKLSPSPEVESQEIITAIEVTTAKIHTVEFINKMPLHHQPIGRGFPNLTLVLFAFVIRHMNASTFDRSYPRYPIYQAE